MKKLITVFAALMLVFALAVTSASAALTSERDGAVLTLDDIDGVSPGDSFAVTLHISGNYEAHGIGISIIYDPTSLVLESCVEGPFLEALEDSGNIVMIDGGEFSNSGCVKAVVMCLSKGATGDGDMFTMYFRLKDGVTVNQQVTIIVDELIYLPIGATSGTDIPFTTHNALITVNGGSTPEGGYDPGGSGVGDNTSQAPEYPTRDPHDPDADLTPAVDVTPEAFITAAPATEAPETDGPATDEPVETDVPDTDEPDPTAEATGDPAETEAPDTAEPAESGEPVNSGEPTPETTSDPGNGGTDPDAKGPGPILYIAIGAVVLAAAAATVLVIRGKKRK